MTGVAFPAEKYFRFEYRHRRSKRCAARGWHEFCDAVNFMACPYEMRTLARRKQPALVIAAAVLDDEWWPADGEREALRLGVKIVAELRRAGLLR